MTDGPRLPPGARARVAKGAKTNKYQAFETWLWYTHQALVTVLLSHAALRHTHMVPACERLTGGTTLPEGFLMMQLVAPCRSAWMYRSPGFRYLWASGRETLGRDPLRNQPLEPVNSEGRQKDDRRLRAAFRSRTFFSLERTKSWSVQWSAKSAHHDHCGSTRDFLSLNPPPYKNMCVFLFICVFLFFACSYL